MHGLFITGTGTGVGKTYVGRLISRVLVSQGHRVGIYKPVASGCLAEGTRVISQDALALWEAAGRPGELDRVAPQRFQAALAPHQAARAEGQTIDRELLRLGIDYWRERSDIVLVEGVGGLMSPMSEIDYNADLAIEFGYPLIVVAPNVLGTINQTLQTLITAVTFREGLHVAGVVLNDISPTPDASAESNGAELEARSVPPLLAQVAHTGEFDRDVDWYALA
ncbi:MAG: dethiobiotin synthase [Pirellulales bacterium]|nr:dethiobiotin synthase [Pirellulales bacterium]